MVAYKVFFTALEILCALPLYCPQPVSAGTYTNTESQAQQPKAVYSTCYYFSQIWFEKYQVKSLMVPFELTCL